MTDLRKLLDEATKGPWFLDEDPREGMEWNIHIMSSDVNRVCFMSNTGSAEDNHANARLIALAPDLAAALLKAEEALAFSQSVLATVTDEEANRSASGLSIQTTWANCVAAEVKSRATLTEIRKLTGAA